MRTKPIHHVASINANRVSLVWKENLWYAFVSDISSCHIRASHPHKGPSRAFDVSCPSFSMVVTNSACTPTTFLQKQSSTPGLVATLHHLPPRTTGPKGAPYKKTLGRGLWNWIAYGSDGNRNTVASAKWVVITRHKVASKVLRFHLG